MRAQVNDARSYDLTLELCIDRPGPGVEPNPLKRRGTYNLAQQCFKWVLRTRVADFGSYSYNPDPAMSGTMPGAGYAA